MQIIIRLLATLRRYLPEGHDPQAGYPWEVAPGAQVGDVLADLPFLPDHASTFFVNGRHANRDQVLQEGDVLSIFPAAGGGG